MARYDYSIGYTEAELEVLFAKVKIEREKVLASASDSGSSYSRIAQKEIEDKFNGIIKALSKLNPEKYPKAGNVIRVFGGGYL